jgi:GntR family transcriptional regulator / MocR family aminotransferase
MARQPEVRDLFLSVERSSGVPLGRQLETGLRDAIRSGALMAGSALPSTRALAEDLSVSRGVVVRAYEQLASEGYINLRQGASPSVRGPSGDEHVDLTARTNGHVNKHRFDLRPHVPDVSLFPRQAWLRSQRQALAAAADADLGYIDSRGLQRLRVEIAAYVGRARGVLASPEQIVVTGGTTHSLSLIGRALARRGAFGIGFENPSHKLLHAVTERSGLRPIGVPVDAEGLVVDRLADAAVSAVVVTPAHQFPTGCALSGTRRSALVRWAIENDAVIIEDEYDAEFRYDRAPINALHALAPERVIYLGSTGKTLAPGIRLGWAVLPRELCTGVKEELALSLLHVAGLDQLTFADFLSRGEFDRHLRRMRSVYKRRRDILVANLQDRLPGLGISGIAAGLHVMIELASFETEADVCERARSRKICLQSLSDHALPGYEGPPGILIGYGGISEPALPAAVDELAHAFAEATVLGRDGPFSRASP